MDADGSMQYYFYSVMLWQPSGIFSCHIQVWSFTRNEVFITAHCAYLTRHSRPTRTSLQSYIKWSLSCFRFWGVSKIHLCPLWWSNWFQLQYYYTYQPRKRKVCEWTWWSVVEDSNPRWQGYRTVFDKSQHRQASRLWIYNAIRACIHWTPSAWYKFNLEWDHISVHCIHSIQHRKTKWFSCSSYTESRR